MRKEAMKVKDVEESDKDALFRNYIIILHS